MRELPSIVAPSDKSGGAHTSRTMMLAELTALLDATPPDALAADLRAAVIDHNVVGKATMSGRQRTYRYLRELYVLDPQSLAFTALRTLWDLDYAGRPLLALLSAMANDPILRATGPALIELPQGAPVNAEMLASAVQDAYPGAYGDNIAAKVGRNTASSWTQSGHLSGRTNKTRARVTPTPEALTYALLIAYSEGARGLAALDTVWCRVFDRPRDVLIELAHTASRRGLLEFKHTGDVTEIGFRMLIQRHGEGLNE